MGEGLLGNYFPNKSNGHKTLTCINLLSLP